MTAYDISGAPVNLQLRWAKIDSSSLGTGHTDTWNLFYQVNSNATGTDVAWQNVNTNFTFSAERPDDAGDRRHHADQRRPSTACRSATSSINFGAGGVTQFADANGNVQVNQIQQDGFPAGQLQSVSSAATAASSATIPTAATSTSREISVATFNGTNFLKRIDGGAFEVTDASGQALFGKRRDASSARRWKAPTPTSPTSSPS